MAESAMVRSTGALFICAQQGHSLEVPELHLQPITRAEDAPICIHGTFYSRWGEIVQSGLSPMTRQHIHFATQPPDFKGHIPGLRARAEVLIHLNVAKCLQDGMALFRSGNDVILTRGLQGRVPADYFQYVEDASTHHRLWPR